MVLKDKSKWIPKHLNSNGKIQYTRLNGNPVRFNEQTGALEDLVTGESGSMLLNPVTVRPEGWNYRSSYDPTFGFRTLVRNIATKSGGDAGFIGLLLGTIGTLARANKPYKGDYNGIIRLSTFDKNLKPYNTDGASAVDLAFYGDDTGFKKYKGPAIKVNGKTFGNPRHYYNYPIMPMDTLYFPEFAKPKIDSIANLKNVYGFNIDGIYSDVPYNQIPEKELNRDIIDVANGSMSILPNKIRFFDLWDNGFVYNRSTKLNPVFIHDVPYKYGPYGVGDLKILRDVINLKSNGVHKDMREFKLNDTLTELIGDE